MRSIQSVNIEKAVVHVLDQNGDSPILAELEIDIDEEVHEFLAKHILKSLGDDENRKARFRHEKNFVKDACEEIFFNYDNFLEGSKKIANHMFRIMKGNNNISSSDLVICVFSSDEDKYIGILKLDYQKTFIHEIEYVDEGFRISIVPQDIGLPGMNQKLQKCAFIRKYKEDNEYDMIVLDKQTYDKNSQVALFFIDDFLNSEIIMDNKDKTKILKKAVEEWTRKKLKDDCEKALEVREEINDALKNSVEVDVKKISDNVFGDNISMKEDFEFNIKEQGINTEKTFQVDRDWVNRKMKKKILKTDTGFEIKGEFENFEDEIIFQVKRNGDGTVDLIVKNVRNIMEK